MLRLLIALFALLAAVPTLSADPAFRTEIVQFASDPPGKPREAPGGGRVLTPAVIYTPAAGANIHGPAIVMLNRGPDSHPLMKDQAARFAAERLAARGYTVMSLYYGLEKGYSSYPFEEQTWAVKAGLDHLENSGYEDFVLLGQGYGAITAAHYLATQPDVLLDNGGEKRVKAVVLVNPLTELRRYPRTGMSDADFAAKVAAAEASVASGAGRFPHTIAPGAGARDIPAPWIFAGPYPTPAEGFLSYWGPKAATRNAALLAGVKHPALVIASGRDPSVSTAKLRGLGELVSFAQDRGDFAGNEDAATAAIARFLAERDLGPRPAVRVTPVDVTAADGRPLQGVLYEPAAGAAAQRPAIMLISGRTADTVQSSTHWQGWRLAQHGYAVFAPGMRISGGAGFESSSIAEVAQDIGQWMNLAERRGHRRVVLAGHSNGGVWLSNYISVSKDPRVIGTAYFAPTRDSPTYAAAAEKDQYAKNVATARKAVAEGRGMDVVIGLLTAHAYLDNNAPGARTMHSERVREFSLPGLIMVGGKDALMADPFPADFKAAYRGPSTLIRYPEAGHGFREVKDRLADDFAAWIARTYPDAR